MSSSSSLSSSSLGSLRQRWLLALVVVLPVIAALVWNGLDANPVLFLYDATATMTGGWNHHALRNKTLWITGASSGIGASMVCQAMQAGAAHVILSSRQRDKLLQVAANCQNLMGRQYSPSTTKLSIVPYDAANETSANITVDRVLKACDQDLDIVILNAGIYQNKPALLTSKQERDLVTRVNYQSPVDLVESLLQRSSWKNKKGHIVVVASTVSHGPLGLGSSYAASKAALRSYFMTLSTEEYSWLRIDVACPGATDTGLWTTHPNVISKPTMGPSVMTADRVAHLILTSAAGPWILFYETWIATAPGLLWVTMAHYTPRIFHGFCHWLSYVRIPVWHYERIDALETLFLLERYFQILRGTYPPTTATVE